MLPSKPTSTDVPTAGNCSGLILAGGQGTRMGCVDKAALRWGDQRFIDRQYQCMRHRLSTVWINRRAGEAADSHWPGPVCTDLLPDQGPLGGIQAGLSVISTPWLLVAPCDAPMLAPDLFDRLATASAGRSLRYAHDGERDQYLFALLHISLLPALNRYLAAGHRSVKSWYASTPGIAVDCSDIRSSFANINTPTDYQTLTRS